MTTKTYYPSSVTQNSANWIASFTNLNNVKTENNDYAYASVTGKSGSKHTPAKITATNFNVSIPTGAKLNKITVQYKQRKTPVDGKYPMLPAPKITLANTGLQTLAGTTPNSTAQVCEKVFAVPVSITHITSDNFGVVLEYQKNTNEYSGELWVYWIRVIVDYTPTSYTISNTITAGKYSGDTFNVRTTVTNKNKTKYTPTVTITAPLGFSFKEVASNGGGTFTQVNSRTFTWQPPFTTSISNLSLEIAYNTDITFPSGQSQVTLTYTASESLNGVTKDTSITVKKQGGEPTPDTPDTPDNPTEETEMSVPPIIVFGEDDKVNVTFKLPEGVSLDDLAYLEFTNASNLNYMVNNVGYPLAQLSVTQDMINEDNTFLLELEHTGTLDTGFTITLTAYDSSDQSLGYTEIPVYFAYTFGLPNCAILEITGEELDRLGNNIPYTAQIDYHLTTENDYYIPVDKNYKLGVFNNYIEANITRTEEEDPTTSEIIETITDSTDYDNLLPSDIISNAEYWSRFLPNINADYSLTTEFVYNEDYPLYLIIAGDYPEFENTSDTLTFDNPCIVEKEDYTQRISSLPYFIPIQDILTDAPSTVSLDPYSTASTLKLSQFDLPEDFGTGDNISIRGIEIIGNIESSNDASITCKLKSPYDETGLRSIVIGSDTTELSIGGLGDLFGYKTTDLTNLNDWEIIIEANNSFTEPTEITITNIQLKIYYVTLESQTVNCYINGEDIGYYGAFLQDLKIPAGLQTSTSFLTIDGTDTNDAYRQNIREKQIQLTLDIGECSLLDSTNQLKQLTQLIVNEKDKYNRPIPKIIEFSHYPGLYWEYIIEESFDTDIDISTYQLTVKLTVPSGTAYNTEDTIVANSGFVNGLVAVNPILTVKPTGTLLTLTETETGQKWSITYSSYEDDDLYIINCENRTVHMRKTNASDDFDDIDISSYVDFNSDWFKLQNDFIFNCENGILQSVQYTERW